MFLSGHRILAFFIAVCVYGSCSVYGRLWPYGLGYTDDQVLTKYTTGPQVTYKDKVKAVQFDLKDNVDIFGKTTSRLKIYENGIVSRNIHSHASLCPDGFTDGSYLMAFWMATDISRGGRVFYRQEVQGGGYSKGNTIDFDSLADEIKRGAQEINEYDFYTDSYGKSTLTGSDIESVIVITWHEIPQPYSLFSNPSHRNTFQMLIVATARGSYVHIVYDRIDFFQFHSINFYCHNAAIAGVTEDNYNFQLTSFFYLTPSSLRLHSNIADYSQLGRYVLVLRMRIPQPSPPRLNCFSSDPDPYCKTGLPPNFCEYRPTGRYPHPSFCDKFVLCNGRITDVQECRGLVYNPWIQNCDWKHNYQCTNVNIGLNDMFQDLQRAGRMQVLFSIRYDILNLNYGIHNNTCVGVPNWGNAIDISTCDHYLMCSNTRTYRVPCPPSFDGSKLYFNPDKNYCDYKRNVDCKDGVRPSFSAQRPINDTRPVIITPPPIVTRSTEATTTVTLPEGFNPCRRRGNSNSPDPLSCDHYYTCSRSLILKRISCPLSWNGKTLYYDADKDQCGYRNEVDCNPEVKVTSSPPKTTASSISSDRTTTNVPNTETTASSGISSDTTTNGPITKITTSGNTSDLITDRPSSDTKTNRPLTTSGIISVTTTNGPNTKTTAFGELTDGPSTKTTSSGKTSDITSNQPKTTKPTISSKSSDTTTNEPDTKTTSSTTTKNISPDQHVSHGKTTNAIEPTNPTATGTTETITTEMPDTHPQTSHVHRLC